MEGGAPGTSTGTSTGTDAGVRTGTAPVRPPRHAVSPGAADLARRVARLGGMYSTELGIDVEGGEAELARWFLAATLFGTRIPARTAVRTFAVLDEAGVRVAEAANVPWTRLVQLLDAGGYARYDERTATRLQQLGAVLQDRYGGLVGAIEEHAATAGGLESALDALPGWGPVTVGIFLRELRGVWTLADPPPGTAVLAGGRHLRLLGRRGAPGRLRALAGAAGLDRRDLECALVRLTLAHRRSMADCPGGRRCRVLADLAPV